MSAGSYDAFTSYKRGTGHALATVIYGSLQQEGYKVFLDVDHIRGGRFWDHIREIVQTTPNFIAILTNECLNPRNADGDVFLQEIGLVIEEKRRVPNIIPVAAEGFRFAAEGISPVGQALLEYDSVHYHHTHNASAIEQILGRLIHPRARDKYPDAILTRILPSGGWSLNSVITERRSRTSEKLTPEFFCMFHNDGTYSVRVKKYRDGLLYRLVVGWIEGEFTGHWSLVDAKSGLSSTTSQR